MAYNLYFRVVGDYENGETVEVDTFTFRESAVKFSKICAQLGQMGMSGHVAKMSTHRNTTSDCERPEVFRVERVRGDQVKSYERLRNRYSCKYWK